MAGTAKLNTNPNRPSYLKDLLLLFAVPAGIAIIAAIAVYAPILLANPRHDFIYASCNDYDCQNDYVVSGSGQLTQKQLDTTADYRFGAPTQTTLRYYDVDTDSSKAITLSEAQQYTLDTSSRDPDGYKLTKLDSSSGFLFWDNYDQAWYLKDGSKKQKVDLGQTSAYGYGSDQVTFLGWVK